MSRDYADLQAAESKTFAAECVLDTFTLRRCAMAKRKVAVAYHRAESTEVSEHRTSALPLASTQVNLVALGTRGEACQFFCSTARLLTNGAFRNALRSVRSEHTEYHLFILAPTE